MFILDWIVYIFSDLIFLHLWGWCIVPLYNLVERNANTAIANSMLLLIELIFYGIVLAFIIVSLEKFFRKRRRAKKGLDPEGSSRIKADKNKKKPAKEKAQVSSKKSSAPKEKPKREYREYK